MLKKLLMSGSMAFSLAIAAPQKSNDLDISLVHKIGIVGGLGTKMVGIGIAHWLSKGAPRMQRLCKAYAAASIFTATFLGISCATTQCDAIQSCWFISDKEKSNLAMQAGIKLGFNSNEIFFTSLLTEFSKVSTNW